MDISIIIPVNEVTEQTKVFIENALASIKNQTVDPTDVLLVGPKKVTDALKDLEGVTLITNKGETDFASQLNLGVDKSKTEWFCFLEFDDELANKWIENAEKYSKHNPDVDAFLPIIVNVNEENAFLGLSNEAVWAANFSTEFGIIDNTTLLGFQGFNIDGLTMKKEAYQRHGGIKPSMKVTFGYEFLLRCTYFSTKVMVIPKFGYKHMNERNGSLFNSYKNTISLDEGRWWVNLAKKEYFHTKDRGLTYDKTPA